MKFTTRVKHAVNAFNEKEKVTNSRGLATDFLRNGNKNKTMLQDWSQVEMSDQDMYTGYSYAAIKKRANRASSLGRKFLYTEASKQIQEAAKKQDIQIIHPYLQLVEKSKEFTKRKFWHDISTYLDLEGVYYLMAVRAVSNGRNGETKVGKIQKLSMLNPYMIRKVIKESDGTVGGYVESRAGLYREIPKEMIIEIRLLNPFDNEKPFSMTDAAKESQFTMKQAGDYTRHSIKGNINSPGAITTDVELDDNVFDNFVSRIQNHSKGEPLYGNGSGAINWSSMQIDLDKAALDKINEIHRSILFAVSGTSKTTLGIEESGTTRDTSQVQKDNFTEDAIMPQVEDIIDALNLDYRKWYPEWEKDEYEILLDNPLESNREAELKDIEIREAELTLRESLIGMGYEYEIASKYAHGDISIDELGEPTLEEEMTDEEVEAVALREVGITKDEKDEEPEASATQGNNLVLRTATNKFVTKEFNQKKLKEAIKQAKTYKAEQKAKAKEAKEKESLKLEAQAKPENKITAEALNQISIGDYPDLYKDIDIDTKDLGCIMINTEMIPVAQYIKDGQDDVYSEGNHSGLVGEEEPHATLLFGLLENGNTWKDKVDKVLEEWELPTVTIEEVTHFELEDSNVIIGLLKKTPELIDGHERLTLLPHVSTHSEYLPHISLAYIKKDVDIDKWVKPLAKKYNGQKVATKGINYGDLPEDTSEKKTNNDSTEARLSHDCSQHEHEANSTLDKAKNALEPAIQHNVALQESDLYTSAQGIQSEMANLIILAIRNGNYQEASELLTDAEARELNKKLKLLLAAYYLTLMPIYGKQLMDVRLGEYGTQGIFAMTDQIERYVDESSQAAADSHIKTIRNDLINAATKAQAKVDEDAVIQAVKWSVEARETKYLPKLPTNPNLEDITKAVKSGAFKGDQALYKRAREFSREGGGLDEMTRAIQKEYQNISKNRARTIARHETNRVFNMAQYQADLQFLQENGWLQKGYKRLRSRTGDPCPVCESLINETTANPIPFEQNFADLGATLNANYKKKDGKTAVQTIPISYEAIKAGNVHVNCRCEYKLIIKQSDGSFLNSLDQAKAENGGAGSGNHGHGGREGLIGGSSSSGAPSGSLKDVVTDKKGTIYYHGTSKANAESIRQHGFDNSKNTKGSAESPYATFLSRSNKNTDDHSAGSYGDEIVEVKATESINYLDADSDTWYKTMGQSKSAKDSAEWADKLNKMGYDGISDPNGEITLWNTSKVKALGQASGKSTTSVDSMSPDEFTSWSKQYNNQAEWSTKEVNSISKYASADYHNINGVLRGDQDEIYDPSGGKKDIKQLDSSMKNKLKSDTTLYRGIGLSKAPKVGQVIKDKGYSSTTLNAGKGAKFAKSGVDFYSGEGSRTPIVLKINAKKGQKSIIPIVTGVKSVNSKEQEVILPRDTSMKVTKITNKGTYQEVEVNIV